MSLRDMSLPARLLPSRALQQARQGDREPLARLAIAVLVLALLCVMAISLSSGALSISLTAGFQGLLDGAQADPAALRDRIVMMDVRLPRVVLGALVGASLAVSGAVMQGLFRNPLADPGIVGVSAGAGLGAAAMIVLGGTFLAPVVQLAGIYALPLAAFLGGLATTFALYRIGTRGGTTSVATLRLAGIGLGALAGAITGLLV